jgi:hypothetical protein
VKPCLCRHGTISMCDSFCFAWHFPQGLRRASSLPDFRSGRVLSASRDFVRRSSVDPNSTPLGWTLAMALDFAAAVFASGQANPHGSVAQRRSFLVCETQRRYTPEPQPSRRLTYRGTDPAGQKLAPAPSDTLSSKSLDVFPNFPSSACPSADASFKPQAEIDVQSLSAVAQGFPSFFSERD